MEHERIIHLLTGSTLGLNDRAKASLAEYVEMLLEASRHFNLTGISNVEDIVSTLVLGSLAPFREMKVPRGTLIVDIGSGGGIPGIPLSLIFQLERFLLIDSTYKKVSFLRSVIEAMDLQHVTARWGRVEDEARGDCRGAAGLVVARGFGRLNYALELGAAFLAVGGLMYIYANYSSDAVASLYEDKAVSLGMSFVYSDRYAEYGIQGPGLLLKKNLPTSDVYPRRVAVIKRESRQFEHIDEM